jgi:23S rRNA pseudouridine1911/1915/1917 synthase
METDTFTVNESRPGRRLDSFLHDQCPDTSRGEIRRLLDEGHVRVNGRSPKASQTPRLGDVVQISWPEAKPSEVLAQDIPFEVVFEDEDIVVINKPSDLVVHPAHGHADGTLVNALLHHCRGQLSGIGGVERPGIVHRLDLGTSGCLVVAKNDESHRALQEQFAARTVEKVYQCVLCGDLKPPQGEIRLAIARHPSHRKRMAVTTPGKGRDAWTSYLLVERLRGASFVEATIHTGRTHQIRVHFQHLGFPLFGDAVYGERQTARLTKETGCTPPRQLLHSRRLGFNHPRTGIWRDYDAPLPEDFRAALEALRVTK